MIPTKKNFSSISFRNIWALVFSIIFFFYIAIKESYALQHDWVGVPKTAYGEQLWDRKSIQRNEDGSVRVLSKFIPKTKSEINQDIIYTMDINCFEKAFRDVSLSTGDLKTNLNNFADWRDPNGDQLILGVIGQVCRVEEY